MRRSAKLGITAASTTSQTTMDAKRLTAELLASMRSARQDVERGCGGGGQVDHERELAPLPAVVRIPLSRLMFQRANVTPELRQLLPHRSDLGSVVI